MTVANFLRVMDNTLRTIIITVGGGRISSWTGCDCRTHAKNMYGRCLVKRVSVIPDFGIIVDVILDSNY